MDYLVLIFAFSAIVASILLRFAKHQSRELVIFVFCGSFAWAYYCLPLVMMQYSPLRFESPGDVRTAFFMHASYFLIVYLFATVFFKSKKAKSIIQLDRVSRLISRNLVKVSAVSSVLYLLFRTSGARTAYQAESITEFVAASTQNNSGLIGTLSYLVLAFSAYTLALLIKRKRYRGAVFVLFIYFLITVSAISTYQRLALIYPFVLLTISLFLTKQLKLAFRSAIAGIILLAVTSPVLVYLRETSMLQNDAYVFDSRITDAWSLDNVSTFAESLTQRADLLNNTIVLKDHIDETGYVGQQFYWSVLVSPIPRQVYNDKPIALSDDGTINGEISVVAWSLSKPGTGSLTAFGAVTAYRQGGWPAVVLDAALLGLLFSFVTRSLGSGIVPQSFFALFVSMVAVRKSPPSLMETVAPLLPFVILLGVIGLLEVVLRAAEQPISRPRSSLTTRTVGMDTKSMRARRYRRPY